MKIEHFLQRLQRAGTKLFPLCLAASLVGGQSASAATYRLIHAFAGEPTDGNEPTWESSLVLSGSTLYGMTSLGGAHNDGVLFSVPAAGGATHLVHDFAGYSIITDPTGAKNDGADPIGTPVLVGSTLYGMTQAGGSNSVGCIFQVNTDGSNFHLLHSFGGQADGTAPYASLIVSGTNLYGMTSEGGTNGGEGTIFSIGTDGGGYRLVHTFQPGGLGGEAPEGGLTISGNTLYGMTDNAIFQVNTDGTGFLPLHTFTGSTTDGGQATGSLVLSGATLYGMTDTGGLNNFGTVFMFDTANSSFQLLHSFSASEAFGPKGSLALSGSTLYGMTYDVHGGLGAVFQIGTDGGGYQIIHTFSFPGPTTDGAAPWGTPLVVGSELYGMTSLGGSTKDKGCVFALALTGTSSGPPGAGAPTLTITGPKPNAILTTPLLTVAGTTAGSVAVTNVTVLLNGGAIPVLTEDSYKTWSASSFSFPYGANTIVATAINANGQVSASKTVKFTYKLESKLNGAIVGKGSLVPNDIGKTLTAGQVYTMTAVPAAGFAFSNWVHRVGIVTNIVTTPKLTFTMEPNTHVTATFVDVQKPTVTFTTPTGTGSNSLVVVTGTAKDNVGVTSLWVQNGTSGWNLASTQNGFSNWTAAILLGPGANTIQAYAEDAAGNQSITKTLTLHDVATGLAPEAIVGTTVNYTSTNGSGSVSFSGSTFSGLTLGSNQIDAEVGIYTYAVTGPNTAQLSLSPTAPVFQASSNNATDIALTFNNGTQGTYVDLHGNTGSFTVSDASSTVPASFSGMTLLGSGFTDVFGDGSFTETFTVDPSGSYTFAQYSPNAALVTETLTDAADLGTTNYLLLNFLGDSNVYARLSVSSTTLLSDESAAFMLSGQTTNVGYTAPLSLVGLSGAVTQVKTNGKKESFVVDFGAASFGQFSADTNQGSGAGTYTYTRTGAKTAVLQPNDILPPDSSGGSVVPFTFINGHTASFTNSNGHGTVTFSTAPVNAPLSLVGRTLTGTVKGGTGSYTFGEGTFTGVIGGKSQAGTYTYAVYGPQFAMVVMSFTDATHAGLTAYLSLWFTTAKSGSFFQDEGNGQATVGTFTVK